MKKGPHFISYFWFFLGVVLYSFKPSIGYCQTLGLTLVKAANNPPSTSDSALLVPHSTGMAVSFQWIASNKTANGGNFFIYDILPAGLQIQSIQEQGVPSNVGSSPALPLAGPASLLVGPVSLAAGGSATFAVIETNLPSKTSGKTVAGDRFTFLTESQLSRSSALGLVSTPNSSSPVLNASGRGLLQSVLAVPNISRNNQPVDFAVNLNAPSQINLTLFTLTGEKVFNFQTMGGTGRNSLAWNLQNVSGQAVASGLYFYYLQVSGNRVSETRAGKILIIR